MTQPPLPPRSPDTGPYIGPDDGPDRAAAPLSGEGGVRPDPPRLRPVVLDDVFDQGSGLQVLPAGLAFEGQDLRFGCEAPDICVDPATGRIEIPTSRPVDGREIRVFAENAGGRAEAVIRVAVEPSTDRAETRQTRILEVDGVRFEFATEAVVGHFISGANGAGDPFVVGPVTLRGYSPQPEAEGRRVRNGAMLNPPCGDKTGYDNRARNNSYDPDLNAALRLPLQLVPGDSLVVAISGPNGGDHEILRFVVLTCVAEPPHADSFRPPYSGSEKPIWRWSDLHLERLARLPQVGITQVPRQEALEARFARFTLDTIPTWARGHIRAPDHPPLYGRDICNDESSPWLWVNTERPLAAKEQVLIGLVQRGIDRYGVFRSGSEQGFMPWPQDGAHHTGRKFSIVFAGHLLDQSDMVNVIRQTQGLGGGFQEDMGTFYVTQDNIDFTNTPAWQEAQGRGVRWPQQPYSQGMLGIPDWRGGRRPHQVDAAWVGNPYRISGNHNTQHGQVLAILAMGLREAWGNDAYFDYHLRYMDIMEFRPDPWRFQGGTQALYDPVVGSRPHSGWDDWQRYWRDQWAYQMLMTYRSQFLRPPWEV